MRAFIALRYEQIKRLAPMISIGLNAGTFSLVLYSFIEWRGIPIWAVGIIFMGLIGAGLGIAALYYGPIGMKEFERAAAIKMDPTQQNKLTPKEAKLIKLFTLALAGDRTARIQLIEWAYRGVLK